MAFPFPDPNRDDHERRGSRLFDRKRISVPALCAVRCSQKPSFLTILPTGHDRNAFLRPPRIKTVLETRFAKAPTGDGFGEPVGKEREHNAPFASSAG
ncbi:MAG: hypothetical protein DI606_18690 [Sphingobium sp.]|nr:MAG: hypothetical protein DI606_18690 [Sphingobium sp.]